MRRLAAVWHALTGSATFLAVVTSTQHNWTAAAAWACTAVASAAAATNDPKGPTP